MGYYAVNIIIDAFQILLFVISVFYLGVSLFSLFPFKYKAPKDKYNKFAVVIPAHNEEGVIKTALLSLKQQSYPKELFKVFVMADFCTDKTAQEAIEYGAVVLSRTTDKTSKGMALSDAFAQIVDFESDTDAFVVIDADNAVDSNFLFEINLMMQQGYSVVQGYVDALNPSESWVSYAYAMWYWITNRIAQIGFCRLGLNCKINGTGFAVSTDVLDNVLWNVESLAEDIEYTAKLGLNNIRIGYAPKAVVYDKKPKSFKASVKQRKRWARGNSFVLKKYFLKLLKIGHFSDLFMLISDFMMPLCWIFFLIVDFIAIMNLASITHNSLFLLWINPLNLFLLNIYVFGTLFAVICGLLTDKKLSAKFLLNIFGFIIYILSWIPITILGMISIKDKSWYHTEHKSI